MRAQDSSAWPSVKLPDLRILANRPQSALVGQGGRVRQGGGKPAYALWASARQGDGPVVHSTALPIVPLDKIISCTKARLK